MKIISIVLKLEICEWETQFLFGCLKKLKNCVTKPSTIKSLAKAKILLERAPFEKAKANK